MDTQKNLFYFGEFGPEMVLCLPYAYWLHNNGLLGSTKSCLDTRCFYYFNSRHIEVNRYRTIDTNVSGNKELPNEWEHNISGFCYKYWTPPPLKEQYIKNNEIEFSKEVVIISNKYNIEWGKEPINYINFETLSILLDMLSKKYTVIYRRPTLNMCVGDQNELSGQFHVLDKSGKVTDYDLCKSYNNVYTFQDLMNMYPYFSFNMFQCKVFSLCDKFITVQGGNSHFIGYFAKMNLNLIKKGREMRPGYFTSPNSWYEKLNGGQIELSTTEDSLIENVRKYYM
jgi:hypothetical protein